MHKGMGLSLDLDEACSSMNLPLSSHVGLGESLDDPELHLPVGMMTAIAVSQDCLERDKHEPLHVKSHCHLTLCFVSRNGWKGSPGHCPGVCQGFLAMGKGQGA